MYVTMLSSASDENDDTEYKRICIADKKMVTYERGNPSRAGLSL